MSSLTDCECVASIFYRKSGFCARACGEGGGVGEASEDYMLIFMSEHHAVKMATPYFEETGAGVDGVMVMSVISAGLQSRSGEPLHMLVPGDT